METKLTDKKINLLMIEDNPGDARLVQENLSEITSVELELKWTQSLSEGIKFLLKNSVDIILLDLSLPDCHGLETVTRILALKTPSLPPIVVLTGLNDNTIGLKAVQQGAQDFLVKGTVDAPQLERTIRYALERSSILKQLDYSKISLNNAKLALEKNLEKINEELEMAKQVQKSFLPRDFDQIKSAEIGAIYSSCELLSGDLYDVIPINENLIGLLILDVAGHGAPSALLSAMAKISFTRHIIKDKLPSTIFKSVQEELEVYMPDHLFITAFLGIFNTCTGEFIFSSAGHPPMSLIRTTENRIVPLKTDGIIIGNFANTKFHNKEISLQKNDKIILFTDGLTESMDSQSNHLGEKRLNEFLLTTKNDSINTTFEKVMKMARDFVGDMPQMDDITLLGIRMI